MSRVTPFAFVAAIALHLGCASVEPPVAATDQSAAPAAAARFSVATFNINFGLAGDPETLAAIGALDVDLIALQETTAEWERVIRARYGEAYPHLAFHHYRPYPAGGVALLSRFPIHERGLIDGVKGWFPAWRVDVDTPGGPLQLLVVHLRPMVSDDGSMLKGLLQLGAIHDREIRHFTDPLEPGRPTIVLGDFNEGATASAIAFLEGRGFVNALPRFDPNALTWRWQTRFGELTGMLDHILVGAELEVDHAEVRSIGRSDHSPVIARIEPGAVL